MPKTKNDQRRLKVGSSGCSAFEEGALVFAALLTRGFDEPFLASQVLKEMGYSSADCKNLDEFDKEPLRKVNAENGMKLRGLRKKQNDTEQTTPSKP